ncbi:MAG: sulfotransferase [Nitrospirae bacterium]|nr:sulfotransferase [Nitrospirota bacterium]
MWEFLKKGGMKLPNFLIVGANKAGTTSLAYYCGQHPDIFMSAPIKEPMFFTSTKQGVPISQATLDNPYFCFTLQDYMDLFAKADEPLRGEASTAYLANPSCALWIKKVIPDARIIAILRNPVERAFSNYKMYHGNGVEKRTFPEAVAQEIEAGPGGLPHGQHYLSLGLYASQLRVFKRYFPDERIFIGDFGRYNEDTAGFLQDIFRFLGAREFVPPDLRRLNTSAGHYHKKGQAPLLDRDLAARIAGYFEKDVTELQTMVGFDVMKWLEPSGETAAK